MRINQHYIRKWFLIISKKFHIFWFFHSELYNKLHYEMRTRGSPEINALYLFKCHHYCKFHNGRLDLGYFLMSQHHSLSLDNHPYHYPYFCREALLTSCNNQLIKNHQMSPTHNHKMIYIEDTSKCTQSQE